MSRKDRGNNEIGLGEYIYPGIQYYFLQMDPTVFIGTAGATTGVSDVVNPPLPYQTSALGEWHKALTNSVLQVNSNSEPLVSQPEVKAVMISRLGQAIVKLDLPDS